MKILCLCHLCYHQAKVSPKLHVGAQFGPNAPKIGDFGSDLWANYWGPAVG